MPRTLTTIAVMVLAANAARAQDAVDFTEHIKPILSDRCFLCHGPDAEQRQADLRLDLEATAKQYAIVPGRAQDSEVYARITHADPDERMPPAESKLSLTADEIERIRRWIDAGAEWQEHWSFKPPGHVPVPVTADAAWPRNAIDGFILKRLEEQGLRPSAPATREKLIRRVTFDLTGLPPTLDELDAFLADSSPDAYERLVDRLLDSKRFGERMAANWLDVARYSDTYGYQVDRDRFVWPWRDWVIDAFNANLPYDRFVAEQLAGDLIPRATDRQILATTFNRLHPQKVEGGSVEEEFRIEYVADRTQTFATALLGLTIECARCHDHKYDPLTQKEFYELSAFFDNIDEAGLYSYFTPAVPTPTLVLAGESDRARLSDLANRIRDAERKLDDLAASRMDAFEAWRQAAPQQLVIPGRIAHRGFEEEITSANRRVPGRIGHAVQLTGDDGVGLDVGNFHRYDPFSVALWMMSPTQFERSVIFHRSRAWTDAGSRGYQLLVEQGQLTASLVHFWPGNAIGIATEDEIPVGVWVHVAVTYDGSSRADGIAIYVNGERARTRVVRDHLNKDITGGGGDHITIGERFRDRGFTGGLVDEFHVFDRQLTRLEIAGLFAKRDADTGESRLMLAKPAALLGENSPDEHGGGDERRATAMMEYYLSAVDEPYRAELVRLRELRQEHSELADKLDEIMVMREMRERRATYVLKRGAYDARGERVSPGTPAVLGPMPAGAPADRLGLAQWLTDPDHPLTARVAVNRFWQLVFADGLVRTPEDFGSQGQPPTHPKLLDWLARDFADHGWDIKRLLKQLVMSSTYQQTSAVTAAEFARDPDNRLLARAPRMRLTAEMLRDQSLAVSGLLVERIGGPPARPYELEVAFTPVARDKGDGLYRRSLYTYWKRTGPAPVMMTLDASKRDVCQVRRERTSSPLQALVILNAPQFVEAARGLAERAIRRHGDDTERILTDVFRATTSRFPAPDELRVLARLYERQTGYFQRRPEAADEYLKTGDRAPDAAIDPRRLAATAVVASTLFGFDESLMK